MGLGYGLEYCWQVAETLLSITLNQRVASKQIYFYNISLKSALFSITSKKKFYEKQALWKITVQTSLFRPL